MKSVEDRFWEKVDKSGSCWTWTAFRDKDGYGLFKVDGKNIGAHRFSYTIENGRIENGKLICHSCDNPSCVRPNHLWLGTHKDNAQDKVRKGRVQNQNGELNPNCMYTENNIRAMMKLLKSGMKQKDIGKLFGVRQQYISKVKNGQTWKHVTEKGNG